MKLNNLKVIHDLCSQYLTQILSKTTLFSSMEGVFEYGGSTGPAKLHEAQLFYMCFNYLPVGDLQGFFSLEKKVYKAWTNGRRLRL